MSDGASPICPGTYDPVTNGHLDIISRAARVFDRVVVGVVNQPVRKQATLFTAEERKGFIERRRVAERARQRRGGRCSPTSWSSSPASTAPAAIVKGLRAISDFEYEFEMNQLNRKLAPEIESVYIIASPELQLPLVDRRQGDGHLRRRRLGPGPGGRGRGAGRAPGAMSASDGWIRWAGACSSAAKSRPSARVSAAPRKLSALSWTSWS